MDSFSAPGRLSAAGALRLGTFQFDVTPPSGHSLCGGWIKPVVAIDDTLEAIGFVLLGVGKPIIVCAVDWTGLLNEAHAQWRQALAEASGTSADRVAVQCVHQHNAPFACLEAQRLVSRYPELPAIIDLGFFEQCLERGRAAVRQAVSQSRPIDAIACGKALVDKVASNRRVWRDEHKRVLGQRSSSCTDPTLRGLPEGLIDPWLRTVAFYGKDARIVVCHYYATHPMSYYGDGRVTSDFAGLARKRRQCEDPNCTHVYFNGCAGDIGAGKYNDGSPSARTALTDRIYQAMLRSEHELRPGPIDSVRWQTAELLPPRRSNPSADALEKCIADQTAEIADRNRSALMLAWRHRLEKRVPLVLSCLDVNDAHLLHLPAECFIEYQLRAQRMADPGFVATAAYGDDGPWYVPTAAEYPCGGYEVDFAFCDPEIDETLTACLRQLLGQST
jgi:hypothetical protein